MKCGAAGKQWHPLVSGHGVWHGWQAVVPLGIRAWGVARLVSKRVVAGSQGDGGSVARVRTPRHITTGWQVVRVTGVLLHVPGHCVLCACKHRMR